MMWQNENIDPPPYATLSGYKRIIDDDEHEEQEPEQ